MSAMNHPKFPKAPESRTYIHIECGRMTTIGGGDFQGLSDPMRLWLGVLPQSTLCIHCGKTAPLKDFIWQDTEETLAAYRSRLRGTIPLPVQGFTILLRLALFIFFPVAGYLLGRAVGSLVLAIILTLVGALIGLVAVGMQMSSGRRDFRIYR